MILTDEQFECLGLLAGSKKPVPAVELTERYGTMEIDRMSIDGYINFVDGGYEISFKGKRLYSTQETEIENQRKKRFGL
ncbi:MAG: hypothetical protein JW754_05105 [Candidatus Aenigmarchaeota archaeon]|nr:hypothetical protein [Candidatus Aenigmarchaeota archaeon]